MIQVIYGDNLRNLVNALNSDGVKKEQIINIQEKGGSWFAIYDDDREKK